MSEGWSELDDNIDIAIIGLSGRFPGAKDVATFWQNLCEGRASIQFYNDDELDPGDLTPEEVANPNYIKAGAHLDDADRFDADFFDIPDGEARWLDPQHRLFLEQAWTALERAGYSPYHFNGSISIYAGSGLNTYLLSRLPKIDSPGAAMQLILAADKDHLATRVSYKLNLKGESISVQTACSSSLVAVHLACQSLLGGQSDMALAGGVSIRFPQKSGYLYQEGMIASPDGTCRAFDHHAKGTVGGNGVGVVVLKMLVDALRDGDHIHAVIKGSAVNNDGREKVGYTAPSVDGQADVIAKALAMAQISPEAIGFVEAHGTGTPLGDPIEVQALKRVYGNQAFPDRCILGSVKTNVGHLDAAAGVTGLIKAALALEHGRIPATVHFEQTNPALDLENSPFRVSNVLEPWPKREAGRCAAVSSFGIGGTNAHVVLEEAPRQNHAGESKPLHLLTFAAKTQSALTQMPGRLADCLETHSHYALADAAFTQNLGRTAFPYRGVVVVANRGQAIERLREISFTSAQAAPEKPTGPVFLFPGQGTLAAGVALDLLSHEPVFRQEVERGAQLLKELAGWDLMQVLSDPQAPTVTADLFQRLDFSLPVLLLIEVACARMWQAWGIQPAAVLGHSHGEYAAACVAGVLSLEHALELAMARGRLLEGLEPGGMLAIRMDETDLRARLMPGLTLAAINSTASCVVAGPHKALQAFSQYLTTHGVAHQRLAVKRAFHSAMLEPILEEYIAEFAGKTLRPPQITYISGKTGRMASQALTDPDYWIEQMRQGVRFADALSELGEQGHTHYLEVGPGHSLTALVRQHFGKNKTMAALPSMARTPDKGDLPVALQALGALWTAGHHVNWQGFYQNQQRCRLPLPTYPFQADRYWIDLRSPEQTVAEGPRPQPSQARTEPTQNTPLERNRLKTAYAPPRTARERKMVAIWERVMDTKGIGVEDDFFELGCDSLMLSVIYNRLQASGITHIALDHLQTHTTIAALAAIAEPHKGGDSPPKPHVMRSQQPELSFAQKRLWVIEQAFPGNPIYILSQHIQLAGQLDLLALARAFNTLVERHEALRTSFALADGRPIQVIAKPEPLPIVMVDFCDSARENREREAKSWMEAEYRQPFDLEHGPLFRVTLFRYSASEHVILMTAHHIVSDAWSLGVVIREIGVLYRAFSRNMPAPLPPLALQYADYAARQLESLTGERLQRQLAYWKNQLRGAPVTVDLPFTRSSGEKRGYGGGHHELILDETLIEQLESLSRRAGTSLFMTLLAAFKTLLYRYSGQRDLVIGVPVAGRHQPEYETLIGVMINMLVLRSDLSGNPSFLDLLARVKQTSQGAFAHQEVPFERIVDELRPDRSSGHAPLFQILFNYQNVAGTQADFPGLTLAPIQSESGISHFDLSLNLLRVDDGVRGLLEYATDLFEPEHIERMARHLHKLLGEIVANAEARLDLLDFLSEEEKRAQSVKAAQRRVSQHEKLKGLRRRPRSKPTGPDTVKKQAAEPLVNEGPIADGQPLPWVYRLRNSGLDVLEWLRENRDPILTRLNRHGAVLLRGFSAGEVTTFQEVVKRLSPEVLDYRYRSTPRSQVKNQVYTSTEYPPDQSIPLHHENAYAHAWPLKLWFYCVREPGSGGETPIADGRRVVQLIDSAVKAKFERHGVLYVRNYGEGLDLPWPVVFQTEDPAEVESYCRNAGIQWEWRSQGRLRTRQVSQAVAQHPLTGEKLWFNQAHLFHISNLPAALRELMLADFAVGDLPRNAYYGNGEDLEPEVLDHIRATYQQAAQTFPWQQGDMLLLDNMRVAHGRNPYQPPRKILVMMAEEHRARNQPPREPTSKAPTSGA